MSEYLSNCHKAKVYAVTGDEGTAHWCCHECDNPCDIYVPPKEETTELVEDKE